MIEGGRECRARSPDRCLTEWNTAVSPWNMHNWATNEIEVIPADLGVLPFSMIRAVLTHMVYWR
jgi:hypothetical protein